MKKTLWVSLLAFINILPISSQKAERTEEGTTISLKGKPILTYVHSETPAPEGVDPIFHRSAYIHPLWSPGGERLTRIQPEDHYHHYGIWNPWTRTRFGKNRVDFWNLGDGQGRVRFKKYLETGAGQGAPSFSVHHEHIYYGKNKQEEVAIDEIWEIDVKEIDKKTYQADLTVTLNTPLEGGILLEAYRYGGGIGFRATEKWGTDNSSVLTSEGKTRKDADGTSARWAVIEGESSVPEGRSGILFLSHPSNRAHPEPMRVWPPDQYDGKSNVFFEFCPIRHQEWKLDQGVDYSLKYRMVVFDGPMVPEKAEKYWTEFAQ
jgi:hypothetical protein